MRIKAKILGFVGLCSMVTLVVATISIMSLQTFNTALTDAKLASQRALDAANMNRLVTSVVVESRGIYAAKDTQDAEKYAARLKKNLEAMNVLLTAWAPKVPASERALFEKITAEAAGFTTLRTETARLGTQVSPKAAAEQGFNEANRANRQAFQDSIETLVAHSSAEVEAIDRWTDTLYAERLNLLLALAIGGTLGSLLIGGFVGARGIARPLAGVSAAIRRLSEGDLTLPETKARRDEIGEIWTSMRVFSATMKEAAELRIQQNEAAGIAGQRRHAEMGALADRFQGSVGQMVGTLAGSAAEMELTARTMAATADQTNRQSTAVMNAANETAMNVQAVAAATEELAATANEIGAQVSQTSAAAAGAVESARRTSERVRVLADSASPHRRRGRLDLQHRQPDQPARPERHHRGGPRR